MDQPMFKPLNLPKFPINFAPGSLEQEQKNQKDKLIQPVSQPLTISKETTITDKKYNINFSPGIRNDELNHQKDKSIPPISISDKKEPLNFSPAPTREDEKKNQKDQSFQHISNPVPISKDILITEKKEKLNFSPNLIDGDDKVHQKNNSFQPNSNPVPISQDIIITTDKKEKLNLQPSQRMEDEKVQQKDYYFQPLSNHLPNTQDINNDKKDSTNALLNNAAKFLDQLKDLQEKGLKFTDEQFPPEKKSLAPSAFLKQYENVKWLRAQDIFQDKFAVFLQGIDLSDILQGNLGDCYFLSSLGALSIYPERVKKMFLSTQTNSEGLYGVKICWMGVVRQIYIDDYFPVDCLNKPFCLRTNGAELWVMCLEKAWAKLHKNYYQIEGQLAQEALHDLTGAPVRNYVLNNDFDGQLWKTFKKAFEKKFALCCGSRGQSESDTTMKNLGLIGGHEYSVLGVHQLLVDGKVHKLFKIRNPWGSFEWQGQWNDNDSIWTQVDQSQQKRVNFQMQNDGTFFIEFQQFIQQFDGVQICYYIDNFTYSGATIYTGVKKGNIIAIKIPVQGVYHFNVSQQSIRLFDEKYQQADNHYSRTIMIIGKEQTPPLIACTGCKRDLSSYQYLENPVQLDQGVYYAYLRIDWQKGGVHGCGFGCYGPSIVHLQQIQFNQKFLNEIQKFDYEIYKSELKEIGQLEFVDVY